MDERRLECSMSITAGADGDNPRNEHSHGPRRTPLRRARHDEARDRLTAALQRCDERVIASIARTALFVIGSRAGRRSSPVRK